MKKTTKSQKYVTISKGIQKLPSGNYRVRKEINCTKFSYTCTSIKEAKSLYKQLCN